MTVPTLYLTFFIHTQTNAYKQANFIFIIVVFTRMRHIAYEWQQQWPSSDDEFHFCFKLKDNKKKTTFEARAPTTQRRKVSAVNSYNKYSGEWLEPKSEIQVKNTESITVATSWHQNMNMSDNNVFYFFIFFLLFLSFFCVSSRNSSLTMDLYWRLNRFSSISILPFFYVGILLGFFV